MTSFIETLFLSVFAWITCVLLLSWALAMVYPLIRRWLLNYPAAVRAFVSLLVGLTPHLLALLLLVIYSQPQLSGFLVENHCHNGECGAHWLHMPVSSIAGRGSVALSIILLGSVMVLLGRQLFKNRQQHAILKAISNDGGAQNYKLVKTNKPLAWCVGYLKPQIYLSSGIVDQLKPQHLNAILAHEQSHAIDRDNLRKLMLIWLTIFWPKAIKNWIRNDFNNDIECKSDLDTIRNHSNLKTLRETIQYIEEKENNRSEPSNGRSSKRILALQKELIDHAQESSSHRSSKLIITMSIAAIFWLFILLMIGQLGHPLLEWLYQ